MFEVELKFPVRNTDAAWAALSALGAVASAPIAHADVYFAHPSRSFSETDEALRLRMVGDKNTLTYKGPVIDTRAKMRREIEVDVATGAAGSRALTDILQHLGFVSVRTVAKSRREGPLQWKGRLIHWTWDDVPPLGTFVELELVVEECDREAARDALCDLADALQLGQPERRSYLELLLEHDAKAT